MPADFTELCHNVRNAISVAHGIIQRIDSKQLEIDVLRGKLAHRLGALEETLVIYKEKKEEQTCEKA